MTDKEKIREYLDSVQNKTSPDKIWSSCTIKYPHETTYYQKLTDGTITTISPEKILEIINETK